MRAWWHWWRGRHARQQAAERLFGAIVARAREPVFYTDFGVADSVDGRFDMIALHTYLVMRRLRATGPAGFDVAQRLFDRLMGDWDGNLRELGVGDVGVPKKVKRMARAYYGRVEAYEAAITALPDRAELVAALTRNVYRGAAPTAETVGALAAYVAEVCDAVAGHSAASLVAGDLALPAPDPPKPRDVA